MVRTIAKGRFKSFKEQDKKFIANIKKYDFTTTNVFCEGDPSFSYTTGFWGTLNHPEIILFGMGPERSHVFFGIVSI